MSVYEDDLVDRCVLAVVKFLKDSSPVRWRDIRNHLIERGPELEPAYKGGLIDSVIFRRTASELQRRGLADYQEWWALSDGSGIMPSTVTGRQE